MSRTLIRNIRYANNDQHDIDPFSRVRGQYITHGVSVAAKSDVHVLAQRLSSEKLGRQFRDRSSSMIEAGFLPRYDEHFVCKALGDDKKPRARIFALMEEVEP